MTEEAKSIINDAFDDINVKSSEEPLEATDAQTAIRALNRLMSSLASSGIFLGYTKVTKVNDPVTVPDGAVDPIISLLAMRLWPKYWTKELPSAIVIDARTAMRLLAQIAVTAIDSEQPNTLPVGSGNYEVDGIAFYPSTDVLLTNEIDQYIAAEENTHE